MVAYLLLRTLLLATLEAPEPRYTLQTFPILIAFAAAALTRPGRAGFSVTGNR